MIPIKFRYFDSNGLPRDATPAEQFRDTLDIAAAQRERIRRIEARELRNRDWFMDARKS